MRSGDALAAAPTSVALREVDSPHEFSLFSKKDTVESRVAWNSENSKYQIFLAGLARPDPFRACPLETLPPDIHNAMDILVAQVKNSVIKIKKNEDEICSDLRTKLNNYHSMIETYLASTTFFSVGNGEANRVSNFFQKAGMVNQLSLLVSQILYRDCISKEDDRVIAQRLLGQAITLGGFIVGGLPGFGAMGAGQLLASIPFVQTDTEKALEQFRLYEVRNERSAFLCMFRQMQKTNCLLFSDRTAMNIGGLDFTYQEGSTKTISDALSNLKKDHPQEVEDVAKLRTIVRSTEKLTDLMNQTGQMRDGKFEAFDELVLFCQNQPWDGLTAEPIHPKDVVDSFNDLKSRCLDINLYRWHTASSEAIREMTQSAYWDAHVITNYFRSIYRNGNTLLGEISHIWETYQYFEDQKRLLDEYRDPKTGNQARVNYSNLVEGVGNSIAKKNLQSLISTNMAIFNDKPFFSKEYNHSLPVRKRALMALLDVCMTLDPTLTCLYPERPAQDDLFQTWASSCVGKSSTLCSEVEKAGQMDLLADQPQYMMYFNSLCRPGEGA